MTTSSSLPERENPKMFIDRIFVDQKPENVSVSEYSLVS